MDITERIVLNSAEDKMYKDKIVKILPTIKGEKYFNDFFSSNDVTSARIGRKFYEDVVDGIFPNVSLAGKYARDGYIII